MLDNFMHVVIQLPDSIVSVHHVIKFVIRSIESYRQGLSTIPAKHTTVQMFSHHGDL